MSPVEIRNARERIAFLTIRLHALMKKKHRQGLESMPRERLLNIAAAKIHESRVLSEQLNALSGFKKLYGGDFNTTAYEIQKVHRSGLVDGEISAAGIEAEKRSQVAAEAARKKALTKDRMFELALQAYAENPSLQQHSAKRAAELLTTLHGHTGVSASVLQRKISALRKMK